MISFVVFFLVFLISGIGLLKERSRGTLDRVMATPIRRGELIFGYILGYGFFAVLQTLVIVAFGLWVFNMQILGSVWNVFLTNILVALVALTLGLLLSAFANSEFQMMQFVPVVVMPQLMLSGLVPLSTMPHWLQALAHCMPLYYGANALSDIIEKGSSFSQISGSFGILALFIVAFASLNVLALKKFRTV